MARADAGGFARVRTIARQLPDVVPVTRYDGLRGLCVHGVFVASMAGDPASEPGSLVIRCDPEMRDALVHDASDTYYVTDHHARYPVVLVRLAAIDDEALADALRMSLGLALAKTRHRSRSGDGDARPRGSRSDGRRG